MISSKIIYVIIMAIMIIMISLLLYYINYEKQSSN